jgi:hypothetical protein
MKLPLATFVCGIVEGEPVLIVVKYGSRSHELKAPWSDDSRHVLKSRFAWMSEPPPNPSLKLIAARGMLKTMFSASVACGSPR